MRRLLALALLLATACVSVACTSHAGAPAPAVTPTPSPAATTAKVQTVPSLSLVDAATLPKSVALDTEEPNAHLKPGSFSAFLTGAHVVAVRWAVNASDGSPDGVQLEFDAQGRAIFERWTREHRGGRIVILVGDRVIGSPVIMEPIVTGMLSVSGRNLSTPLGAILEPAIVER